MLHELVFVGIEAVFKTHVSTHAFGVILAAKNLLSDPKVSHSVFLLCSELLQSR
jgi:hypothetical protein